MYKIRCSFLFQYMVHYLEVDQMLSLRNLGIPSFHLSTQLLFNWSKKEALLKRYRTFAKLPSLFLTRTYNIVCRMMHIAHCMKRGIAQYQKFPTTLEIKNGRSKSTLMCNKE